MSILINPAKLEVPFPKIGIFICNLQTRQVIPICFYFVPTYMYQISNFIVIPFVVPEILGGVFPMPSCHSEKADTINR